MNMKQILVLLGTLAFLGLCAEQTQAEVKMKVAVVNIQQAINQSTEGQKAKTYFQQKLQSREKEFRAKGMAIKAKDEQLQASMMLAEEARQKKQDELDGMKRNLQHEVQKAQAEYRQEESKQLQRISQEIILAVRKIGEREKYDFVMEATLRQTLLYTRMNITDITDDVIKEYNKMKAGGN